MNFDSLKTRLQRSDRSLVYNATVSYCVTVIVATVVAMGFIVAKQPIFALVGIVVLALVYFIHLASILRHVKKHPEAVLPNQE